MVETQLRDRDIVDEAVLAAMERVPRELFVPEPERRRAYDDAALPLAGENKTFFTARVNPRSSVRPGHPISLTVDTRRLHYFDPSSGLAIGHPANTAAGV